MSTYRNTSQRPIDLASGQIISAGESVSLPKSMAAHDAAHVAAGRLTAEPTKPKTRTAKESTA